MNTKLHNEDAKTVSRFITAGYFYDILTQIDKDNEFADNKHKSKNFNISKREKDLLKLVADGKTNDEIAGMLYMSKDTVTNRVEELFTKLGTKEKSNVPSFTTDIE